MPIKDSSRPRSGAGVGGNDEKRSLKSIGFINLGSSTV
jgi:hypothetical protein